MTVTVGFFGKLPAHGDFVRRGLTSALAARLDDWMQAEFMRGPDPTTMIATLEPVRFASSAIADDELALGAMIASSDRVGRAYVLIALRLSPHPSGVLPVPMPPTWDDWCGRAEALLSAARDGGWTADATQAALDASARAAVIELTSAQPFPVPDETTPMTASWRPTLGLSARRVERIDGLPRGAGFDRFIAAAEEP